MLRIGKRFLLLGLAAVALCGCGRRDNVVEDQGPELLYQRGYDAMDASNFAGSVQYFSALEARYPFSPETRQAQLDLIYVYYRSQQPESAIDAAEEFERENPTHERIDYCLYMRGLVYFDQAPNIIERLFRVDLSLRPPKDTHAVVLDFPGADSPFPEQRVRPGCAPAHGVPAQSARRVREPRRRLLRPARRLRRRRQSRQVRARALSRSAAAREDACRSWSPPTSSSA